MTLGVVMLAHTALDRAAQVIRRWHDGGCPVVVHVDLAVDDAAFQRLQDAVSDLSDVRFCKRYRCAWGTWGLVAATQEASAMMLAEFAEVQRLYLASGACLPLRPVEDLRRYLAIHPDVDFIESTSVADVHWVKGGLGKERFYRFFLLPWKNWPKLFQWHLRFQRRWNIRRKMPDGLPLYIGSQWWCLTRKTVAAILSDPQRKTYDQYFKKTWIPDESYFQTLTRLHSDRLESRSLTLCKFDFQGKPHVFYDDHLRLLSQSDCFVARKVWPNADRLYDVFLNDKMQSSTYSEPNPVRIDRIFSRAVKQRVQGRAGLYMQSRLPKPKWNARPTAEPYWVFQGFSDLFPTFEQWLSKETRIQAHGHLFAPMAVEYAGRGQTFHGCLSHSAKLRDYDPQMFLRNFLWNGRGQQQGFMFGPQDRQAIIPDLVDDTNAHIAIITGAWAVSLCHAGGNPDTTRARAAKLQNAEQAFIRRLTSSQRRAHVQMWTMAEFLENPVEFMQIALNGRQTGPLPDLIDLSHFGEFLQDLRNQGMNPHLMGTFSATGGQDRNRRQLSVVE